VTALRAGALFLTRGSCLQARFLVFRRIADPSERHQPRPGHRAWTWRAPMTIAGLFQETQLPVGSRSTLPFDIAHGPEVLEGLTALTCRKGCQLPVDPATLPTGKRCQLPWLGLAPFSAPSAPSADESRAVGWRLSPPHPATLLAGKGCQLSVVSSQGLVLFRSPRSRR